MSISIMTRVAKLKKRKLKHWKNKLHLHSKILIPRWQNIQLDSWILTELERRHSSVRKQSCNALTRHFNPKKAAINTLSGLFLVRADLS